MAAEVEDTIKRIASHKGVEGIIICNYEGVALKSTLNPQATAKHAGLLSQLVTKARSVIRTLDAEVSWQRSRRDQVGRCPVPSAASPLFFRDAERPGVPKA
jgi:Roadblock/LC7 domain